MSSRLSEAQDAFFQAFAAMTKRERTLFANYALDARLSADTDTCRIALAAYELTALAAAIDADTSE